MRLIDADELLKHKTDHEYISTHLIYNAPTVDAVPTQSVRDINVLNKIRVEIKEELKQDNHSFYRAALEDVLKIIDKYKAGE